MGRGLALLIRAFPLHLGQCIIDENGAYRGGWARPGQTFRIHFACIQENGDLLELRGLLPAFMRSAALGPLFPSESEISLMCSSYNNVCRWFATRAESLT